MSITITYDVDMSIYNESDHSNHLLLVTTEFLYKNDILVHLQFGKNFGWSLDNLLSANFKKSISIHQEQFLAGKTYSNHKPKIVTQSTYAEKMKRFDMNQTEIRKEILEEYSYTDSNQNPVVVKVVITAEKNITTATVDFEDATQHKYFVCPPWLTHKSEA